MQEIGARLNINNLKRVYIGVDISVPPAIRQACPELERVRLLVGSAHTRKSVSKRRVRFVKINSNLEDLMDSWIQEAPRGFARRDIAQCAAELLGRADQVREDVASIMDGPDWKNIDFGVSVMARRETESRNWRLRWEGWDDFDDNPVSVEKTMWYKDSRSVASRYDGIQALFDEKVLMQNDV